MSSAELSPQSLNTADVPESWRATVNAVAHREGYAFLTSDGVPVAALVSMADLERLRRYDAEWDEPFKILDEIREGFKDVSQEEIEREVSKALAEVRAEQRGQQKTA